MTIRPHRHVVLRALVVVMLGSAATAGGQSPSEASTPAFRTALPDLYFSCRVDAECLMVTGWCAHFSINKAHLSAYKNLPNDPKGKGASDCPPGWLPPGEPRSVCDSSRQCRATFGHP